MLRVLSIYALNRSFMYRLGVTAGVMALAVISCQRIWDSPAIMPPSYLAVQRSSIARFVRDVIVVVLRQTSPMTALMAAASPKPPITPLAFTPPSPRVNRAALKIPTARANASRPTKSPLSSKQRITYKRGYVNEWRQWGYQSAQ